MIKRWSYFIRKVYEADPLTCPKCQGKCASSALLTSQYQSVNFETHQLVFAHAALLTATEGKCPSLP